MKKWKILLPSLLATACAPIVSLTACHKEKINYTEVMLEVLTDEHYTSDLLDLKNGDYYKFTFTFVGASGNLQFLINNIFTSTDPVNFTCKKVEVNGAKVDYVCNQGKLTFKASGSPAINIYVKINEDKSGVYAFCAKSSS